LGQAGFGSGIIVPDLDQELTFSLTTRKSVLVPDSFSKFSNFYSKWFDYGIFVHLKLADCLVSLF
jgi:hypothetical protein